LGRLEKQWKHIDLVWNRITSLLGWMICAKRPLKRYEIQCAFCLDLTDEYEELHNVESKGLTGNIKDLCGTLVREIPGGRLELVHNTARMHEISFVYYQRYFC